jgi:transcriptional regulator with XRE-family HTH domain
MDPGEQLKEIRNRLGLSTREVAVRSQKIANQEGNSEFSISSPWLTQIENEEDAQPSIYKIFSMASIYGVTCDYILSLYGVDVRKTAIYHAEMPTEKTHPVEFPVQEDAKSIELPLDFDVNQTSLLSRTIETWGSFPLGLIQSLDLRHHLYGYVGLKDYTLYPIIHPGTFVSIDPERNKPRLHLFRSEYERPIYFVDLRKEKECVCGWCEVTDTKLLVIAHPLSGCETRIFAFPGEAEIIGQVTGVAMGIAVTPR